MELLNGVPIMGVGGDPYKIPDGGLGWGNPIGPPRRIWGGGLGWSPLMGPP